MLVIITLLLYVLTKDPHLVILESGAFCYFILKSNSTSKAFLLMILPLISQVVKLTNVYEIAEAGEWEPFFALPSCPLFTVFSVAWFFYELKLIRAPLGVDFGASDTSSCPCLFVSHFDLASITLTMLENSVSDCIYSNSAMLFSEWENKNI